jgi:hypothetical protein
VICFALFAKDSSSVTITPPPPEVMILFPLKEKAPIFPKVPVCLFL